MTETSQPTTDGKTIAIISYLTLIGWIIAFILHGNNRTSIGAFHLRQSAILIVTQIALTFLNILTIPFGSAAGYLIYLLFIALLVLWIIGLINAVRGEEKRIPVLGDLGEQWFAGVVK